jgi:spermidine synthase
MAKHKARRNKSKKRSTATDRSFKLFALILGCFFLSGITGLTYEILWTRMIVKIIGSSPFAVSIVLTVFMAGLGLGSYLAGRTIDRIKEPLKLVRIYGVLELCIGAYGLLLPLLLAAFKPLYAVLYNHLFHHFLAYNLLTFVGCALLLIVPVTCMGATLPILSRFFVTSLSRLGTRVGRLYGLNTIGAAVGSLLCGFWMINSLGVWGTLLLTVIVNGIIGAACILVSAKRREHVETAKNARVNEEAPTETRLPGTDGSFGSYALVIFAVSGFCAMAYEVIWIKLLGLIVGPTTYSFTIVLVTFITGLALGAMFFGWLGDRIKNTMTLLLVTQIAAALFALMFSQVVGNSQIFFAKLIYEFKDSFAHLYLIKAVVLFVFMFPPTFCLGATFPLVGKIYTTSLSHTGRSIGFAYAVNSVGAVLGSFCAGFLLIPFVGKENGLSLVIAIQLLTALFVGIRVFRKAKTPLLRWSPLVLVICLGVGLACYYPHWDRKMLAKGKYHRVERSDIRVDKPEITNVGWLSTLSPKSVHFADDEGEELVYYGDGIGGFTAVLKQDVIGNTNYVLLNSGKPDASFPGDMATQTLFAHFPMLFHPNPKNVLIVGLASGITAGEVLNYPVERLDVVDINEKVVAASDYFLEWNNNVLSDPRTRLIIQDARAHLAMTDQKYDVISSEPSNPWMAGLASLFTRDFFELARDHLNDGGLFVQFAHAYEMDWHVFAMIGRTFSDVFPNSFLLNTDPTTNGGDYLLIGMKGEAKLDASIAAQHLKYAQRSKNITLLDHRLFYSLILSEDLERLFGDGPVHTENRPYLEFAAPKLLYIDDPMIRRNISDKKWLSDTTREIIRRNSTDLDTQIDFAAYALSVYRPAFLFQNRVDLSTATPAQRERFSDLLVNYCKNNVVRGLFLLQDEEIRERCVSAQVEVIEKRMARANNQIPFLERLGEMWSEGGQLDRAANCLSKVLELDPNDVDAHNNLGVVLTRQEKYDEAIDHYRKAIKLAPDAPRTYNNLGSSFARQGKAAEALACFSEALRKDADFVDAHYNMGNALASQGNFDDAIDHFAAAIRLNPGFAQAHSNLGDVLLAQGKLERAVSYYSAALRIQPDYALAHYGLASALAGQGNTAEAIEHLFKAVELEPDYVEALNSLAWTLATDGNPGFRDGARAVTLAERACDLTGDKHPLLLDTLAAAYAESGEFDRARETAQKAITLARSARQIEWAQNIEPRLGLYNRGLPYHTGSQ